MTQLTAKERGGGLEGRSRGEVRRRLHSVSRQVLRLLNIRLCAAADWRVWVTWDESAYGREQRRNRDSTNFSIQLTGYVH